MEPKFLRDLARKYHETREFITNEEMTKQALIVPLIAALGYDPTHPREVRLEYTAEFTQNDGKRLPDRMDYAIFDSLGQNVLLVIEAKPLGFDVSARSPQLARYMSQLPQLRFGVITDGCDYLFFSDLNHPNVMDMHPFFRFSLADPKLDFDSVAKFLTKFSRDQFNAERLIEEAEDSSYRQQMIERLVSVLKAPDKNDEFVRWLTEGIYTGKRTTHVMERLGRIAREAMQPAILRTLGDDFLATLRMRINEATGEKPAEPQPQPALQPSPKPPPPALVPVTPPTAEPAAKAAPVTTEEETAFLAKVRDVCVRAGESVDNLLGRDTQSYYTVSYKSPTRWFVRLFSGANRKAITTLVPLEEATGLAPGFVVEAPPPGLGASRINIDSVDQVWALSQLIVRSLEICKAGRADVTATPIAEATGS
jgi:predicted type IV restriction endonuclease